MPENALTLESKVDELTLDITTALAEASFTRVCRFSKFSEPPPDVVEAIQHKNRIKNRAYRTGDPRLKAEANRLGNIFRRRMAEIAANRWDDKLRDHQ